MTLPISSHKNPHAHNRGQGRKKRIWGGLNFSFLKVLKELNRKTGLNQEIKRSWEKKERFEKYREQQHR